MAIQLILPNLKILKILQILGSKYIYIQIDYVVCIEQLDYLTFEPFFLFYSICPRYATREFSFIQSNIERYFASTSLSNWWRQKRLVGPNTSWLFHVWVPFLFQCIPLKDNQVKRGGGTKWVERRHHLMLLFTRSPFATEIGCVL